MANDNITNKEHDIYFQAAFLRFLPKGKTINDLPKDFVKEQRDIFLKPKDIVANHFEVIENIGFGSMGAIYKVKDLVMNDQQKVLKIILPSLVSNDKTKGDLIEAVRTATSLKNDNIVVSFEMGKDNALDILFITMELLEGCDLNNYLKIMNYKLGVIEACNIVIQICHGLIYAHQNGIFHRDIRPQNIFISPDGKVKLLNFGLSKIVRQEILVSLNFVFGYIPYMSPEQMMDKKVDLKTDIFSLGVVFYQMLVGNVPIGIFDLPSQINEDIPAAVDSIINKCMRQMPEDRFGNAYSLSNEIESIKYEYEKKQEKIKKEANLIEQHLDLAKRFIKQNKCDDAINALQFILSIDNKHQEANELLHAANYNFKKEALYDNNIISENRKRHNITRNQRIEVNRLWDEDPVMVPLNKARTRAVVIVVIILFAFAGISIRLINLMIFDHDKLSKRAAQQYAHTLSTLGKRGVILDSANREMATTIESNSLFAVPSNIKNNRTFSSLIAPIINISEEKLSELLLKKKEYDFVWLSRQMGMETSLNLMALNKSLYAEEEIGLITEMKRYYPKGKTASHVLGFTNIDCEGIAGLELWYNDYLKGKITKDSISRDARGHTLTGNKEEAFHGSNIKLTIDEGIQYIVESELADAIERNKAKAASAIMINPMTGEILALANIPTFDPNYYNTATSDEKRNRAIIDRYELGSTFQIILSSAALEEEMNIGKKLINDVNKYRIVNDQETIQKLFHNSVAQIGHELGKNNYCSYIEKYGFGKKTGIDLPEEIEGVTQNDMVCADKSLSTLLRGQEIGATSIQLLQAYAAIANNGLLMKPFIVSEISFPNRDVNEKISPKVDRRVVSEGTAKKVVNLLQTVFENGGHNQNDKNKLDLVAVRVDNVRLWDIKAKHFTKDELVSYFVGFAPSNNPKIALIVTIFGPLERYSEETVAITFKNIIDQTFAYIDMK